MKIGHCAGCHQKPERSFFYHGYKFPVCARCTGVTVGQLSGMITFFAYHLPRAWSNFFLFVMFFDWFLQYMKIYESNNIRRFITGLLCGYALGQLYLKILLWILWYLYI